MAALSGIVRVRKTCALAHRLALSDVEISAAGKPRREMDRTEKQELLRRSADLVGKKHLAQRLRISEAVLEAWMRGDSTMPDGQLLRLAEILADASRPGTR